jgi:CspA family cold shock protein
MWMVMATGTVRWFDAEKGFGFIARADGAGDVFVHFSAIDVQGYRTLSEGDKVAFEVERGPRGLQATKVKVTQAAHTGVTGRPTNRPERPQRARF